MAHLGYGPYQDPGIDRGPGDWEIQFAESERETCPVCGEKDCVPSQGQPEVEIIPYSARQPGPEHTFVVDRDVWQQFWISPKRKSSTLLYSVGALITPEEAERVGLTDPHAPKEIHLEPGKPFHRAPIDDERKAPATWDDPRLEGADVDPEQGPDHVIGGTDGHSLGTLGDL